MDQTTQYEYQMRLLYYQQFPPMHTHINNIGANIAYTIYQCNATKKSKKLKFEDFKLNYVRASMTDDERMLDDFEQFEKANPKLFKVN
jgi:hypothetical protein